MARMSRVDETTQGLLDRIVAGEFPANGVDALPAEGVLAEQFEVSRLTIREAVKVLVSQQVLRRVQGRGTYVNPVESWMSLSALIRARRGDAVDAIVQLVEVRAMIEVGAIELLAAKGGEEVLVHMREDLHQMVQAHRHTDVEAFVQADLTFHGRIIDGCGNPFVPATFAPISDALRDAREQTSSVSDIREHAIEEHGKILTALESGSVQAASAAMRSHLLQTRNDAHEYLNIST